MKAIIEFEIKDTEDKEDTKKKLLQDISYQLQDWLDGNGTINIKFTTDYENNKDLAQINWITDNSIN
tara:strand:+ start:185 stop:385 length:201 start_codon:yes stop_codon:yes gene_type:complete